MEKRHHPTGRLYARRALAARSIIALAAGSGLVFGILQGCSRDADRADDAGLPSEWRRARIDPAMGGRYLADENSQLTRFQDRVLRSGSSIPYPHYQDSRTIVMAIKSSLIDARTRRRLRFLLDNEAADPDLSVLVVTDQSPAIVAEQLELATLARSEKLSLVRIAHQEPAHVSFPFLRDYAPIVRVRLTPTGARTVGLVLFRQSTLNKVVDRPLGITSQRKEATVREKYELTRHLVDLYTDRIGHHIEVHHLDLLMDGGNLITDGRGTCFLTRVFLDKNHRSRDFVEKELAKKVGCVRSVFLDSPQRLDLAQHVDTLLYFADPQNVVLSMPTLYESDRTAEFKNLETLLLLGYKIHRLPRKTASITYANILTTKANVYVPQYSLYKIESREQLAINKRIRSLYVKRQFDRAKVLLSQPPKTTVVEADPEVSEDNRHALEVVQRLLPEKRVVPADSDDTIHTMGSWHCLTHELPERL